MKEDDVNEHGWTNIFNEIKAKGAIHDILLRTYLTKLHKISQRNVILYYSGWLDKTAPVDFGINDNDKNGFMTAIKGLNTKNGLDLILHTPGGNIAAIESIVEYIHSMFDDIRAIVPQAAFSGGTMIAMSCKSIIMGKQSSLGPIDPQFNFKSASAIIEEFKKAKEEVEKNPHTIPIWQPIIAQYTPTVVGECDKAVKWSEELACTWLRKGIIKDVNDEKIRKIIKEFGHDETKSHDRHLSAKKCKDIGLNIEMMEDDQQLQDAILDVHHITKLTIGQTAAYKIIQNHDGKAFVDVLAPNLLPRS